MLDPTGDCDLAEDTVPSVGISRRGDQDVLRLRYRTDTLDAEAAARTAGYHLEALALIAADPDAEHRPQSLLSVAEAFGTDDRRTVESYCLANAIEFDWQPDGRLRTNQRRKAIVDHPVTGQRCWFNQIAFLSEWTMRPEVREFLVDSYGADGLPFNTRSGNGDPISEDVVQAINEAYEAKTTRKPLHAGDLLLVDNIRTAHSRDPFEGPREVLVAMGDGVRLADA